MGWDQADAAYLLGIHQRTVSRIEAGIIGELTERNPGMGHLLADLGPTTNSGPSSRSSC